MSKKVLRLEVYQPRVNYRQINSIDCRHTYPMPPPSTIIGAIHNACDWKTYHQMKVSISAKIGGLYEQFFTQVSPHAKVKDRGILIKTTFPNALGKDYVEVCDQGAPDILTGDSKTIINKELYETYNYLDEKIKTTSKELKSIKENLKSLQREKKKCKDEKLIDELSIKIAEEENPLKTKSEYYESILYEFEKFMVIFKKFNSYEVISGIYLYLYFDFENSKDLEDAFNNVEFIDHIGRSEDSVRIIDYKIVELDENIAGKESDNDIQSYIDVSLVDDDIVFSVSNFNNGGTVYYLPKDYKVYTKEEAKTLNVPSGQRIFNKYWLMNMSKITVDEDVDSYENLYFDNTNGKNIVVNLI